MSNQENKTELVCTYDPLKEFLAHYANAKSEKKETGQYQNMTIEEKLKQRIIDGDKLGLDEDLRNALTAYSALQIINDILLGGMKVVGELFGSGEMQLPFVLQSAETMKAAVRYLEPYMEKVEGEQSKGVMVLATVKGDVHDIGKNLVDIILTNNGYRVVNLGIKVPLEQMLDAAVKEHADAIGMSGLLVKSTAIMKENLEIMKSREIAIPVVLGGAALTRKFVERDLRALYNGYLSYAQDAFDGLHFMERVKSGNMHDEAAPETKQAETREEMLAAMEKSRAELLDLLVSIPPEEYYITESFGTWTLRDVIAHLIGWERLAIERFESIQKGVEPAPIESGEVDAINDRLVQSETAWTKDDLLATLENVRAELVQRFRTITEEEFNRSGACPAIKAWLPHFTYAHEAEHTQRIQSWRDAQEEELDQATGQEAKAVLAERSERVLPWLQKRPAVDAAKKIEELRRVQEEQAEHPVATREIETDPGMDKLERTSTVKRDATQVPTPPFWGSSIVDDIKLEKVWEYLNETALFRGQWQIRRGKRSADAYDRDIETVARPKLQELKLRAKRDRVLAPKVVYGYFPCYSEGDELVVLRPAGVEESELFGPGSAELWKRAVSQAATQPHALEPWLSFGFPRQSTARHLCIADFFLTRQESESSGRFDVVSFSAVTVGRDASEYTRKLFEANEYTEYLYMHGLSVETAEALAEYWHKIIRTELGIAHHDAPEITRLFSQGYQGSRYSFGYPACPDLEDQTKLFTLLRPERIDVTLTEEYHLEPEQSTTAIVCHHPAAKYFSIK